VLGGEQATVRVGGVARLEDLVAQSERGGVAAGEVGADERAGRAGAEHRPVADIAVRRVAAAEAVVGLR
jgi:hypothetical protein